MNLWTGTKSLIYLMGMAAVLMVIGSGVVMLFGSRGASDVEIGGRAVDGGRHAGRRAGGTER